MSLSTLDFSIAERVNKYNYPEIDASAPLDDILWMFFKHDLVCIRNMLPPNQVLDFYSKYIVPIYKDDDEKIASNYTDVPEWEKLQIIQGWIANDRLEWFTDGAATLEDVLRSHLYTRMADRIMGSINWRGGGSSCFVSRYFPEPARNAGLNVAMPTHLDALWRCDKQFMLNFVVALTEYGKNSPGFDFILSSPDEIKKHGQYNPSLPDEPKGPHNTLRRLNIEQFTEDNLQKAFGPERHWSAKLAPGDVVMFSNWTPYKINYPKHAKNISSSVEFRLYHTIPDSPLRPVYSD